MEGSVGRWIQYMLLATLVLLLTSVPLAMEFELGNYGRCDHERLWPHTRSLRSGPQCDDRGLYECGVGMLAVITSWNIFKAGRYSMWVQAAGYDSLWIARVILGHAQTVHWDVYLERAQKGIPSGTSDPSCRLEVSALNQRLDNSLRR